MLAGCSTAQLGGTKELTVSDFTSVCKKKNLYINDMTKSYKKTKGIKSVTLASNADSSVRSELFVFSSEDAAKKLYKRNISYFKSQANAQPSKKSGKSWDTFEMTNGKTYYKSVRYKNTVLGSIASGKSQIAKAKAVIKATGYDKLG